MFTLKDYQRYSDMLQVTEQDTLIWKIRGLLLAWDKYPAMAYLPPIPMTMESLMTLRKN